MNTLIVSLSATLGSEVFAGRGNPVAILFDVICNKDTGKITYFIVCPHGQEKEAVPNEYYGIHHSYFYFDDDDEILTFNAKLGNDEHSFYMDLPSHYDEMDVKDLTSFNRFLNTNDTTAGHRSDNE
ncbi:hypothetical protein [Lewinella sp. IMCC34191]|uniref:hypothetical protein n=1 Tax=Lewinella sp. IMCC34191 TaxID=2259172 RepID=UPI001300211E|nr:hypothetical protein [Lewinella sp. IMCC34191]